MASMLLRRTRPAARFRAPAPRSIAALARVALVSCLTPRPGLRIPVALRTAQSKPAREDESDPDFRPQLRAPKTASDADVKKTIEEDLKAHEVFVYMKGEPHAPMCGFSARVCRILDHAGVVYGSRNVLEDMSIREGIKQYTSWPTIPQVFIKGEFIGGSDIVASLYESGELKEIFAQKGVKVKPQ